MPPLINCHFLSKSYGSNALFSNLSLSLFQNQRLGIIGPNGAGKSTLLNIIAGDEAADSGKCTFKSGLTIGFLKQNCEFPDQSPFEILFEALKNSPLADYEKETLAYKWLTKIELSEACKSAATLSGGWKKRLALAKEMIKDPDVLLLDEPTNHLDLEGVMWLEAFLNKEVPTCIFISHDRYFLNYLATRIVEINPLYPQGLFSIEGSFKVFLEKKTLFQEGQLQQERSIASKAKREKQWLKESPKARRTKAQSRVDAALNLLQEHVSIVKRNSCKKAQVHFESSQRQTQKLLSVNNLKWEIGGRTLFQNLDFTLCPKTRLGIVGPNGSGKTTLLKLLAGELQPSQGTIKQADDLKIVYFDQHRMKLSPDLTLRNALSPNGEYVFFRGSPIHVNGWAKRFLFSPDNLDRPIKTLSGGERARIAIAHLMLQPADILLLDEPANDLDMETLQTLEENLNEFSGAIVLITHDRYMLNELCNLFLALGNQAENELFSQLSQWQPSQTSKRIEEKSSSPKIATPKKGLSFNEKRELEKIEREIPEKENELAQLTQKINEETVVKNTNLLNSLCSQIATLEAEIHLLYETWNRLEEKKQI